MKTFHSTLLRPTQSRLAPFNTDRTKPLKRKKKPTRRDERELTDEQQTIPSIHPNETGILRTEPRRISPQNLWPSSTGRRSGRVPATPATVRSWCRSSRGRRRRSQPLGHGGGGLREPTRSSISSLALWKWRRVRRRSDGAKERSELGLGFWRMP